MQRIAVGVKKRARERNVKGIQYQGEANDPRPEVQVTGERKEAVHMEASTQNENQAVRDQPICGDKTKATQDNRSSGMDEGEGRGSHESTEGESDKRHKRGEVINKRDLITRVELVAGVKSWRKNPMRKKVRKACDRDTSDKPGIG